MLTAIGSRSQRRLPSHSPPCGLLLLVGLLALLSVAATRDLIQDLIFVFYMLALAQCWNLLAGYAGLVSVGQQAFVGLGGYFYLHSRSSAGSTHCWRSCSPGRGSALFAIPTGFVVFRFRGAYFAIGSWVVAEVYRLVFAQFKQLGGGTGTSLPPFVTNGVAGIDWVKTLFDVRTPAARDIITYWAALAFAAGTHRGCLSAAALAPRACARRHPRPGSDRRERRRRQRSAPSSRLRA